MPHCIAVAGGRVCVEGGYFTCAVALGGSKPRRYSRS